MAGGQQVVGMAQQPLGLRPAIPATQSVTVPGVGLPSTVNKESKVLDKRRLQELVKEVDPLEQLDEDVEEVLMQIADDFIESVVTSSCKIAKHRKSNTLDVKDVQMHLEHSWGMWVPGFGTDELRPYKRACTTEAHKQRMALIRKTLKKS
ncbi:transcription initiation factor TFIID subunit 12-like isoform X2 [Mercenaria mercenaria]|nr:transcription initiation factor TFIID subunit 12-like isoform X2 [Mercenaria mercenaria]